MSLQRPGPTETPETKPFWDAAADERFVVQRCESCEQWQYPYRGICCHCWGSELATVEVTHGEVFTHSTIYRNDTPGFEEDSPYVVAMVKLDRSGDLVVMTNIVDCNPDSVHIGMPVEVTFRSVSNGRKLPMFRPRDDD